MAKKVAKKGKKTKVKRVSYEIHVEFDDRG
jgi:hypothetical protein